MAIRDHVTRVAKLRAKIHTVDPSQRLIEVITADGSPRHLFVTDIRPGFVWPIEGEDWSIYEENGYWVLGNKFLNPDEAATFEALQPGDMWPPDIDFEVIGTPNDGDRATWVAANQRWEPQAGGGGGGDLHFTFSQGTPSAFWTITHTLNKYPSVSIVDSVGNSVEGSIHYIDPTHLTISFVSAFSGMAYLN